jgi:dihydroorotase
MASITLPAASDMHVHLRQGAISEIVAPATAARCHRVLAMPNTDPPILTGQDANLYKSRLKKLMPDVDVLSCIKLSPTTTPEVIREAYQLGVTAVKLYPGGVTTNSHDGIPGEWLKTPPTAFLDCIEAIRETGMVLCMHGEMPGQETHKREQVFLSFVDYLALNFPELKFVLEHISTKEAVEKIKFLANNSLCHVAATITVHHLFLTMDDVIGDVLKPHNFCKPIAKYREDREALRFAAMGRDECFFLGSDSAPHHIINKECEGCAGCYTAPVMVESLIEMFDKYGRLDILPSFMSTRGNVFYSVDDEVPNRRYEREDWKPDRHLGLQPWRCGETLKWKLA